MKDRLLGEALIKPKDFPWKKLNIDKKEVSEILKKHNLDDPISRIELSRKVQFSIFLLETQDKDVIEELGKEFDFIPKESLEMIKKWIRIDDEKARGELHRLREGKDVDKIRINIATTFRDMIVFYEIYKGRSNKEDIIKKIEGIFDLINLSGIYFNTNSKKLTVDQFKEELNKRVVISDFAKMMAREYGERIEGVFSKVLGKEEENVFVIKEEVVEKETPEVVVEESKDSLEDELFSLFSSIEEPKEEKKKKPKEEKSKKDTNNEEEELKRLAKKLGYNLSREDEVVLSKKKYESLVKSSEEGEINVLKELAKISNGASLSELYNIYKNINNTSIGNIEASLSSFFMGLSVLGFEPIEDVLIGKEVKVKKDEILKKYIFEEKVQKIEEAIGIVKYYGWSYKDKRVVPTVLKIKK